MPSHIPWSSAMISLLLPDPCSKAMPMSRLFNRSSHGTARPRLLRTSKTVYTVASSSISWKMNVRRFLHDPCELYQVAPVAHELRAILDRGQERPVRDGLCDGRVRGVPVAQ